MENYLKLLTFIVVFTLLETMKTNTVFAQLPNVDPLYDSVFYENFNGSLVDNSKWVGRYPWGSFTNTNTTTGTNFCTTTPNMDLPGLRMDVTDTNNYRVGSGTCKITAKKENFNGEVWLYAQNCNSAACNGFTCLDPANPTTSFCWKQDFIPFKYSNGMLASIKKFKYGYFEIRFKVNGLLALSGGPPPFNNYNGYAPSFWMFNTTPQLPWSEIDVYEIDAQTGKFTNNIHVHADPANTSNGASNDAIPIGYEPYIDVSQWHKASVHWTPSYIDFYLDDSFMRRSIQDTSQYLIPMPMIIGNDPAPLNFCLPIDPANTPFPVKYELDYVRVFQPKLACDTNKVYLNTTQNTFKSKIYKSLIVGGTGGSATFNNGKATATATDFVQLEAGFEAGTNLVMTIDVQVCWDDVFIGNRSATELQALPHQDYQEIYTNR